MLLIGKDNVRDKLYLGLGIKLRTVFAFSYMNTKNSRYENDDASKR